ncbi:MAG: hypothetical protein NTV57_17435 [Cyanobacteria bacterium]|nr:hypothetical protein [Cyanobacteriota bacterium]
MKRFRRLAATWPGPLQQRLAASTPLLFALLAAVLLHLLVLSYRQLRAERPLQPRPPQLADDSPELLRFSRRQSLEESLLTVPLPPLSSLPPEPAVRFLPPSSGLAWAAQSPEERRPGAGQPRIPGLSAAGRAVPVPRRGRRPLPPGTMASTPAAATISASATSGPDAALAALELLRSRSWPDGEEPPAGGDSAESDIQLWRPGAEAAEPYRRIWGRAAMVPGFPGRASGLPADVVLRRLPLAALSRGQGFALRRQGVLLDDRLLLLWPDDTVLWLLQAPLQANGPRPR